jgi:hypothetical protein
MDPSQPAPSISVSSMLIAHLHVDSELHRGCETNPGGHTLGRTRCIIVALISVSVLGCRTREDAAHKVAREGTLAAADSCADAAAVEACRQPICRARCAPFSDSVHLLETCITQCMGRGTCNSDLDCDRGHTCVMIAPRLRRCEPRTDAYQ